MTEDRFDRLFADLDAAHAGAEQHERMGEYGDLVAGELAQTTLEDRLAGALGTAVEILAADERITGELAEIGTGWCRIAGADEVLVNLDHVHGIRLRDRSAAGSREASVLSLTSPLRRWAAERRMCRVRAAGRILDGLLAGVARDHLEMRSGASGGELVPFGAVSSVRALG